MDKDKIIEVNIELKQKKITRVEQEYHDILLKTEFLKQQKQSIKKDI